MIPGYQLFIGGEWVDAASGESFETIDPATGAAWARVPEAGAEDVDAAVRAARAALADPEWADLTPAARGRLLRRLADILRR
ncbi:MAG TPA: aldehyde dehydrogenase family protein, partial [Gaiellales bacterium]